MKKAVFYLVFVLMFLMGGFLNYFGILSYKMIFGAALPMLLLPFIKVKVRSFFFFTAFFSSTIMLSAVINRTDLLLTIWFFQNVANLFDVHRCRQLFIWKKYHPRLSMDHSYRVRSTS